MGRLVELTKQTTDLLDLLIANPKGIEVDAAAKQMGMTAGQVKITFTRLKNLTISVTGKHRNGRLWMSYKAPTPEIQVMMQQAAGKVIEHKKKSDGAPANPAAATTTTNGKAQQQTDSTDMVFPTAPDLPDVTAKYGWYIEPGYYPRLVKHLLVHGHNLRLKGPPGIGKSSAIERLAAMQGIPIVNINCEAGLRWRDLVGKMTDLGRYEVAQFAAAVVFGWWAKLDEANAMDPDAAMALNSILAPPYQIVIHGKMFPVHPSFRMVMTYNPGLIGTKPLPDSLKDRLYPFDVPFPAVAELRKMLKNNGVDIEQQVAKNMIQFAMDLVDAKTAKQIRYDITVRTLLHMWSDVSDGVPLKDAVQWAMIDGIDSAAEVMAIKNVIVASSSKWK